MKVQMTLAMTLLLPAMCFSQHYQISSPIPAGATPNYGQPSPNYAQPAPNYGRPMPNYQNGQEPIPRMPAAPVPRTPAPSMNYQMPAQGMACDAGGCDSSVGGSFFGGNCGFDGGAGCGLEGGVADCCSDNCGMDCCGGGTYFTIFIGSSEMDDQTSTGYQRNLNIDFNQGYSVGGAFGRRVGRNIRMELEYAFRSQSPDTVQFNGNFPGNVRGLQNSHAGMLNFAYDMVLGLGNIVPYVGGGVGVASVDSRVRYGNGVASLDGDDTGIAYQWMAGLSYRARPNMEMFVEYRFFEIDDPKLNRFGGPAIGTGMASTPNPNILLESEYISQDIMAGIRFNY